MKKKIYEVCLKGEIVGTKDYKYVDATEDEIRKMADDRSITDQMICIREITVNPISKVYQELVKKSL